MKKILISVLIVAAVCGLGAQGYFVGNFIKQEPRLEIIVGDPAQVNQVKDALKIYAPRVEGETVAIQGENLPVLLEQEVQDILKREEIENFKISDNTQSVRLAKQSVGICVFVIELIALVLIASYVIRSARRCGSKYKEQLAEKYPKDILSSNLEFFLATFISWAILLMVAVFLAARIVAFDIYIPSQCLPPEYILDFGFYAELFAKETVPALTEYAKASQTALAVIYTLCAANSALFIAISAVVCRKTASKSVQ